MTDAIDLRTGIPPALLEQAALLYDEAFGAKFAVAVRDREKRLRLLADALEPAFAVAAVSRDTLLGVAGFQTGEGALTGGLSAGRIMRHLGFLAGTWACLVFALYERKAKPGQLLMDGIAVRRDKRGLGIGTRLIDRLKNHAREGGFRSIRLDVIDTNPAARRLYERHGFVAGRTERFDELRWLLGFSASTTMVFDMEAVQ